MKNVVGVAHSGCKLALARNCSYARNVGPDDPRPSRFFGDGRRNCYHWHTDTYESDTTNIDGAERGLHTVDTLMTQFLYLFIDAR